MEGRSQAVRPGGFDAQGLQRAREIVIRARCEVWFELGAKVEIGIANSIHGEHPAKIVPVQSHQAGDREDARDQHDREHEDRDRDERHPEVIGLRDERQRDHRSRQDGEKHVYAAE